MTERIRNRSRAGGGAMLACVLWLCLSARAPGQPAASAWPMADLNGRHSSCTSLVGPDRNPQRLWKVPLGANSFCQPVQAADGTIYATTVVGNLVAVTPGGAVKWAFPGLGGSCYSSAAVAFDGTVYYGAGEYLYAVNPDGTERWHYRSGIGYVQAWVYSPTIASDGAVHFATRNGDFCMNPDGTIRWRNGNYCLRSTALLPNGDVLTTGGNGYEMLYRCFDAAGASKWTRVLTGSMSAPVVAADGTIYAANYDGDFYVLDPATGTATVAANLGRYTGKWLSLDELADKIYISDDSALLRVSTNGSVEWTVGPVGGGSGPAIVDGNGMVFCAQGQVGNAIHCYRADNALAWRFIADEPEHHFNSPSLGRNGVLYATNWSYAGTSGYPYAIIPEPATLALVGLPGLAVIGRRRR